MKGDGLTKLPKEGKRPDLVGGGLKSSNGCKMPLKEDRQCYDSRVLGGSDFVERVLKELDSEDWKTNEIRKMGWEKLVLAVAALQGVEKKELLEHGVGARLYRMEKRC